MNELLEKNPELMKTLDLMFDAMKERNLLSDTKKSKEDFISQLATNILNVHGEVTEHNLRDKQFQKKMWTAMIGQHISDQSLKNKNNEPELKINFKKIFDPKPQRKLDEKQMEAVLKELFKAVFTHVNKSKQDSKDQLSEKEIDRLAELAARPKPKPGKKLEADPEDNELTNGLKKLFGGRDPRYAGKTGMVVYCILGDAVGTPDYSGENEVSTAFIDCINSFNMKEDPTGAKYQLLLRDDAIDGLSSAFEEILRPSKSKWPPRPTPQGTV